SVAHARMLGRQGILSPGDADALVAGLEAIAAELRAGSFPWPADAEDVHSAVEQVLSARIGPVAGTLHTARSRNDQVALDLRLFALDAFDALDGALRELGRALVARATDEIETVMPGYTHLQRAQPVSLAHHLLAHVEAIRRDRARVAEARERATGSSIMPQKKNPDVPELVRGRAGRIVGDLVALLTTLKGLPLAYDGDLQEQRVPLYDAATAAPALAALALVVRGIRFDRDAMRRATERGMLGATDLADHLAARGVPFREAHAVVGRIVRDRLAQGEDLAGLTAADLRRYDERFGDDAAEEIGRAHV